GSADGDRSYEPDARGVASMTFRVRPSSVVRLTFVPAAIALLLSGGVVMPGGAALHAQTPAATKDPRVGLKAGLRDAGVAARNMALVESLPKPKGFFDPAAPGGEPTEAERPANAPPDTRPNNRLNFANSDLAFKGDHLFVGNFQGFNTYDIEDPKSARLLGS